MCKCFWCRNYTDPYVRLLAGRTLKARFLNTNYEAVYDRDDLGRYKLYANDKLVQTHIGHDTFLSALNVIVPVQYWIDNKS